MSNRLPASHYESPSLFGLTSAKSPLVAPSASVLGKRTLIQEARFERHVKQVSRLRTSLIHPNKHP